MEEVKWNVDDREDQNGVIQMKTAQETSSMEFFDCVELVKKMSTQRRLRRIAKALEKGVKGGHHRKKLWIVNRLSNARHLTNATKKYQFS